MRCAHASLLSTKQTTTNERGPSYQPLGADSAHGIADKHAGSTTDQAIAQPFCLLVGHLADGVDPDANDRQPGRQNEDQIKAVAGLGLLPLWEQRAVPAVGGLTVVTCDLAFQTLQLLLRAHRAKALLHHP